jgi:hypothetical protein
MRYRFSFDDGSPENLNPTPDSDDQRTRPRTGPIEKIADITYDALRKHEIERGDEQPSDDSR